MQDGIFGMLPSELMVPSARKLRATYAITPNAPIIQKEFGFYCLDRWYEQGLAKDANLSELFGYDERGNVSIGGLGWCEAGFNPIFEEKVLEDRGQYELVQDFAGRAVLCFKGRRSGFMPEYVDHPVKDQRTWEEHCKWRMNPKTPARYREIEENMPRVIAQAKQGKMVVQQVVGAYMYLRSLMGPEQLLYLFYDDPDLITDCMQTWFNLADTIIAEHQKYVTIDEFFIGEDICYNHGCLISPDMMQTFILPYYQQLITNIKKRQLDPNRHLYFQVDTDGFADPVIPIYRALGMDVMSPFEVASNCCVLRTGKEYPDLVISGGIDKRVLAKGKDDIDEMVDRILPAMKARGGYIPTCDHGVPEEVSLDNYMYYRKRMREF